MWGQDEGKVEKRGTGATVICAACTSAEDGALAQGGKLGAGGNSGFPGLLEARHRTFADLLPVARRAEQSCPLNRSFGPLPLLCPAFPQGGGGEAGGQNAKGTGRGQGRWPTLAALAHRNHGWLLRPLVS